jgi:hypothetical protein
MEDISAKILKAYAIFGSKLGIPAFKYDEEVRRGVTWSRELRGSYYFSLSKEDRKKKRRHCVPIRGGFFDYHQRKVYPDLKSWYENALEDIPEQGDLSWQEGIVYGRRPKFIPLSELTPFLETALAKPAYQAPADSFQTLLPTIKGWVNNKRSVKAIYICPETARLIPCHFVNMKLHYTWNQERPKWIVRYAPKEHGPSDPVYKEAATLSEMGVPADKIFLEHIDKYFHSYKPLSELVNTA